MAKDERAFMEVHLPINQIIVDKNFPAFQELARQEYTDEAGLKNLILKSTPHQPNRVFSLIGETGSGKSELCQWLYYQTQDERHIPILIRRSMTRLRDIVAEISHHLKEPVPVEMRDITDLWEESVSKQLIASILMHLQKSTVLEQIGTQNGYKLRELLDTRDFELTMRQNFVAYRDEVRRLDKPRDLNLLPEEQFAALVTQAGGLPKGVPAICYQHIQRAITDCLTDTLQVEDLIDKLRRISVSFKAAGQRPVLLIEDITTFIFLQNDLLDFLFDLASGNFDVVIGITTDFERANEQQIYKAQQTIRERIEGRFVLTNEQNETLFLRDNYIRLAALYLEAIKDKRCPVCHNDSALSQAFDQGLYPFNEQFLGNVYNNLQQDGNRKQTPRLYLRVLGQALRNEAMYPFTSVETLSSVRPPTAWFAQTTTHQGDLEKLLRWYGHNTNQGIFLAQKIAEMFDISVPAETEVINGFYRFNLRPGGKESLPSPPPRLKQTKDKPKLSITRIEPREGLVSIPNTIHIEGTEFQKGCKAHLGEILLDTSYLSPSRLQATVPADLSLGTHQLIILNPDDSQISYPNAYTVKERASPSLTSLQPNEGEANQSNEIYLQGTNFQKGCVVHLGDIALNTVYLKPTQLRATVPADLASGPYDVTVTNPDKRKATLFNAYTIKPEDLFGQLDQWLERQGRFPGRAAFKDGVWKLLDMFQFNPFVLQRPDSIANKGTPLIYNRGDRSSQIYLHDSADNLQAGYLKLTIHPQKEFRDLYSQVLATGQGHYKVDDTTHLDHPLLYDWLKGCVDELQQEMISGLTSALNMPLEQFIILAKYLLLNNAMGLVEFTPEVLAQPVSGNPFTSPNMADRPTQFFQWRNDIQSLFMAFFYFRDSLVNYPYLSEVMGQCNPLDDLLRLRNIDADRVYDAYKIGPAKGAYSLRGLANLVSLYARDLLTIQQNRQFITSPNFQQLQTVAELCFPVDEIDPEKMRNQLDILRRLCSAAGLNWQRQWDLSLQPLDKTERNLDFYDLAERLERVLSRFDNLDTTMNVFLYLSFQREVHSIAHSPEYEVLNAIHKVDLSIAQFLLHRPTPDLKQNSRYQAFEKEFDLYLKISKQ
jgi:hypothetical protein